MKKLKNTHCHTERSEVSEKDRFFANAQNDKRANAQNDKRADGQNYKGGAKVARRTILILLSVLCAALTGVGIALFNFNSGNGVDGVMDGGNKTVSAAANPVTSAAANNYKYTVDLVNNGTDTYESQWNKAVSYTGGTVLVTLRGNWTAGASGFGTGAGFENGYIKVPNNKNIILDLNGNTINRNLTVVTVNGRVMHVDGTLEIMDSSGTNAGKITGGYQAAAANGTIVDGGGGILVTGNLTLSSGTITENKAGSSLKSTGGYGVGAGIFVDGLNAVFTMNGGVISKNAIAFAETSTYSGGSAIVGINWSSVIINGGLITENDPESQVALSNALHFCDANLTINGGKITNHGLTHNNVTTIGFYGAGKFRMYGGEISGNVADYGAAAHLCGGTDIEIYGGRFLNNYANGCIYTTNGNYTYACGGALYIVIATVKVYGGEFIGNKSELVGSAIAVSPGGGILELYDALITQNTSLCNGAAICGASTTSTNNGGIIKLYGGNIINNFGGGVGGAAGTATSYSDMTTALANTTKIIIGGPVVIRGNEDKYNPGTEYNLYIHSISTKIANKSGQWISVLMEFENSPIKDGKRANIGISHSYYYNTSIRDNVRTYISSNFADTANTHSWDDYAPEEFFTADKSIYSIEDTRVTVAENGSTLTGEICIYSIAKAMTFAVPMTARADFSWEYTLFDGTATSTVAVGPAYFKSGYVTIPYAPGQKITSVTAKITNPADSSVTTYSWTPSSNTFDSVLADTFSYGGGSWSAVQTANYSGEIENVGTYTFVAKEPAAFGVPAVAQNTSLTIIIMPVDATVNIDDKSCLYGESGASDVQLTYNSLTTFGSGDIELSRQAGDYVRKYTIAGVNNNPNYNVDFVNAMLTINQRPVGVVINNDKKVYGSSALAVTLGTSPNTANAAGESEPLGGWQYASGSKTFVATDLTSSNMPFKLTSSAEYTAAQSSATGFAYPQCNDYTIVGTAVNGNYSITFSSPDGTSVNGKLTITKAKINVTGATAETSTAPSKYDLGSVPLDDLGNATKYPNGKKGITIPYTDIVIAGNQSAAKNLTYIVKTSAITSTPAATDTSWQAATSGTDVSGNPIAVNALQKSSRGTYEVYFKITVANHEPKILLVSLKITPSDLSFSFDVKGWKMNTSSGNYDIPNNPAAGANPVYDKNGIVEVAAVYTTPSTGTVKYKIYYKGTNTGNTFGHWNASVDQDPADATNDISVDGKKHKTYGTTEKPSNAGTYTVTVISADDSDYELKAAGGVHSTTLTIDKMKITKAPADNNASTAKTYTAAKQTFTIKDFDFDIYKLGTLPAGITDDSNTFASGASSSYTLQATNAGEYKVPFAIKDTDNYEWDSSVTVNAAKEYELKLTIKQAPLTVNFKSPAENATPAGAAKWTWKLNEYAAGSYITYEIDQTKVMPASGTKETVTVQLLWCKTPESGSAAVPETTDVDNANKRLDVSGFGKGSYTVYVKLADGNAVNKNYTITLDETSKLPTVCKKAFNVTDGNASLAGVKWNYTYTLNGAESTEPLTSATVIKYALNNSHNGGGAVAYTAVIDADSLPEYLEVNTSYAGSGFTAGYKDAKKTNAGTNYKTVVALKIKDSDASGNPYTLVFDSTDTTSGFKYIGAKACEYTVTWTIAKGEIDLSGVEWGYVVGTDSTVKDFRVVDKLDASGNKIPVMADDGTGNMVQAVDEDGNPLFEKAYEVDNAGLSKIVPCLKEYPTDLLEVDISSYSGSGYGASPINKSEVGNPQSTTVTFTLKDSANFEQPDPITFEWKVTNVTLDIKGWNANGKVTAADGKTYGSPTVKSDDPDIADKVKYEYTYNGTSYTIEDLWALADADLASGGNGRLQGVTVKVVAGSGCQLDSSKPESFYTTTTTLGYTGTPISVKKDTVSGEYGKASVKITLEAAGLGDVTDEAGLYKIEVYNSTGENLGELDKDVKLNTLNSGVYRIVITTLIDGYTIKPGDDEFDYTVTPIELDLPTLVSNPTFTGGDIEVEDLLDETTKANLALLTISGQGAAGSAGCRDTGATFTLVITIKDPVNYKWKTGGSANPAKYVLTAAKDAEPETKRISDGEANIEWEVLPLKIVVTDDMWKLNAKGGPKLNYAIPSGIDAELAYVPYESKTGGSALESFPVGTPVWTSAVLMGADAEAGNIVFADSGANETASRVSHTEPKAKDFKQVAGKAVDFVKSNWLWFAIGLGVLLFLILLIILIAHRRKTKEKREEKKAAKEAAKAEAQAKADAEKERREAEKQRLQEQREAEKAKLESQREIEKMKAEAEAAKAKAQAEAEIAKIKAQAQAQPPAPQAMPQAMPQPMPMPAMQQQMPQMPMQPQMPQAMPQTMPMQQPQQPMPQMQQQPTVDNGALARIEAELAAIRAQVSRQQYAPQPQVQAMPMQTPAAQSADGSSRMEAQLAAMQAQQAAKDAAEQKAEIAALRAENRAKEAAEQQAEIAALRAEIQGLRYGATLTATPAQNAAAINGAPVDMLGALMVAALKNLAGAPAAAEQKPLEQVPPQTVKEETSRSVSASYPPDAIITTTTTVDRTKKTDARGYDNDRDSGEGFTDIDGFYEKYE